MNARLSRIPQAPGLAALVLRLILGVVLMAHGLTKLGGGVGSFAGVVRGHGIPFPMLTAYATVTIEILGGAMLLVGLLTRLWGTLAMLLMVGTSLTVKLHDGLLSAPGQGAGMELDLLVLAAALAVTLLGPGPASLDALIGIDRPARIETERPPAPSPPAGGRVPVPSKVTTSLEHEVGASARRSGGSS